MTKPGMMDVSLFFLSSIHNADAHCSPKHIIFRALNLRSSRQQQSVARCTLNNIYPAFDQLYRATLHMYADLGGKVIRLFIPRKLDRPLNKRKRH